MLTNFTINDNMKKQCAFTLIELIVLLALVAVMTMLATGGVQQYARINRTSTQTNDLVAALQLARSEAIKRNTTVLVCASSSVNNPTPQCDSVNWHDGWIVFVDTNLDALDAGGAFTGSPPAANDVIVRLGQGFKGGTTVQSISFTHNNYIRYSASGRADSTGTFVLCDSERTQERARAINVSLTGLITLAEDTDTVKDFIVDLPDGTNVTCP